MRKKCLPLVLLLALTVCLAAVACVKTYNEGAETGVYYHDTDTGEALLTLSNGKNFTLSINSDTKSGTYSADKKDAKTLTLTFNKVKDQSVHAPIKATFNESEKTISLSYDDVSMTFLKRVVYTVTFETNGGGSINSVKVLNGKSIPKPNDPTRLNHDLLGWYSNKELTTPFIFGSTLVRDNLTLYAAWVNSVGPKYTIDFNVGDYDGAPEYASVQTSSGKLYSVPTPTRDGHTFQGWWVSMLDDAKMLSYRAYDPANFKADDIVFEEDTTLFAEWTKNGVTNLAAPMASVDSTSVRWTGITDARGYKVAVVNQDTQEALPVSGAEASALRTVDFANAPAGEYKITVQALGRTEKLDSDITTRYYINKGLTRVSLFTVIEPSILRFNEVKNAAKYKLEIHCGDPLHKHGALNALDNGKSTYYNFVNCQMREGGIKFRVIAEADGYAASTSREFTYNRQLDKVTGFIYDSATETLSWDDIPAATNYIITINGTEIDNGNKRSYCIKEQAKGDIELTVLARANGYNSAEASEYNLTKTTLATPKNIRVENDILKWDTLYDDISYDIRIGSNSTTSPTNELPLSGITTDTEISVSTAGANASLPSDPIIVSTAIIKTAYTAGVLYWNYVIGAQYYQVSVNGVQRDIESEFNKAEITLQAGRNKLSVRFFNGSVFSEWSDVTVDAYTITFETNGGTPVDKQYKAIGDPIFLPESTKDGYNSVAWYDTPVVNGARFTDSYLTAAKDLTIYAYWPGLTYTVLYDYGDGFGSEDSTEITYQEYFKLDKPSVDKRPESIDEGTFFVGWSTENGNSKTLYTSDSGEGLDKWDIRIDGEEKSITLYAYWGEVLKYDPISGGNYEIGKGKDFDLVSSVVVPSQYKSTNNKDNVTTIHTLSDCKNLISITIPTSISIIDANAFAECTSLINIYVNGVSDYFTSREGILYKKEGVDVNYKDLFEITCYPAGRTGTYSLDADVIKIGPNAFSGSSLNNITLHSNVTAIGASAFKDCKNIASITIPKKVLNINNFVFQNCINLKTVSFEDGSSLNNISSNAFSNSGIESITIPAGVTRIGQTAFENCTSLKTVTFESESLLEEIADNAFEGCSGLTDEFIVPAGVKDIGRGFNNCTGLKTISFAAGSQLEFIAKNAFEGCTGLTKITIPASIINKAMGTVPDKPEIIIYADALGDEAFKGCTALEVVDFEEGGIEDIRFGKNIFDNCISLKEITIPANVTLFIMPVNTLLADCISLEKITVHDGNTLFSDEGGVLYNKDKTELVFSPRAITGTHTMPNTTTIIQDLAFKDCTNLSGIVFSTILSAIRFSAFQGCVNLSGIAFPDNLRTIGSNAFQGCTNLNGEITIPKSITSLGASAFADCTRISTVTFASGGTAAVALSDSIFLNCTTLTEVTISNNMQNFNTLFAGCTALDAVHVNENNANYASDDEGVVFTVDSNNSLQGKWGKVYYYPLGKTDTIYTIPASVSAVDLNAFRNNPYLSGFAVAEDSQYFSTDDDGVLFNKLKTSLIAFPIQRSGAYTIPDSVTTIGNGAFQTGKLEEITIPSKVTSLGNGAFRDCKSLKTVNFESGGTTLVINGNAFRGCSALEGIEIPARVTTLGTGTADTETKGAVFAECTSLKKVSFEALSMLKVIGNMTFYNCVSLVSITLPSSSIRNANTSINGYAFYGCSALKSLVIPITVKSINENAFLACGITFYFRESPLTSPWASNQVDIVRIFLSGTRVFDTTSNAVTFNTVGDNGTVSATLDNAEFTSGGMVWSGKIFESTTITTQTLVFTAVPQEGYRVKEWKLDGVAVNGTALTYTLRDITAAHNVTVEFELIP